MSAARPPRVLALGESLVRLSTPGHERLGEAGRLDVHVGGAEMNALLAAAALGVDATWVTRLADNPLGRRIAAHAQAHGLRAVVDWDPSARAPLYFVEHGLAGRPTEVHYDREGTAMRALGPETFAWPALVAGHAAVVSSGITCALGSGPADAVRTLFACARAAGARTAFDVNHRARLWSWEAAAPVLRPVLAEVDVLLASRHDLLQLLGRDDAEDAVGLAREALATFGHELVVLRDSVRHGDGAVAVAVRAVTADAVQASATYEAGVVDPFGAGDAALGALLAGLLGGQELGEAIDQAAWACAFQHTTPGDAWSGRPSDLAQRRVAGRSVLR
jgi:2-dehydro-3-deoxygluconokinase